MEERFGRTWKLFVMVAAGLGTLSFFLPFLECELGDARVPASPYRILIGVDDVAQIDPALRRLPEAERVRLLAAWNATVRHEVKLSVAGAPAGEQASRIPYFYGAIASLLFIAGIAIARRQLGFLAGFATVSAGLCGTWGWTREVLLIRRSFPGGNAPIALSSGATLFGIAGVIALAAGIASLVWADPGGFRARRKVLVQLHRGEAPVPVAIDMPTDAQNAAMPTATLRVRSTRSDGGGRA